MKPITRNARAILLGLFVAALAACSSRAPSSDSAPPAPPAGTECISYERELRACFSAVGAPTQAADTFAAALAEDDDATRAAKEDDCRRDRARLRASCQ